MANTKTQHKCIICNEHLTPEQLTWWNQRDWRKEVLRLTGETPKEGESVFCCSNEDYSEYLFDVVYYPPDFKDREY